MIIVVFSILLWVSVLLNQVFMIFPLKALHIFDFPPALGIGIMLGIFAWIFGD